MWVVTKCSQSLWDVGLLVDPFEKLNLQPVNKHFWVRRANVDGEIIKPSKEQD